MNGYISTPKTPKNGDFHPNSTPKCAPMSPQCSLTPAQCAVKAGLAHSKTPLFMRKNADFHCQKQPFYNPWPSSLQAPTTLYSQLLVAAPPRPLANLPLPLLSVFTNHVQQLFSTNHNSKPSQSTTRAHLRQELPFTPTSTARPSPRTHPPPPSFSTKP